MQFAVFAALACALVGIAVASDSWINIRVYNEGPLETVGLYYGSASDDMLATIGPHGVVLSTVDVDISSSKPLRVCDVLNYLLCSLYDLVAYIPKTRSWSQ